VAAAVRSTGGALSHASALVAWDLTPPDPAADIHLTVARRCGYRPRPGVVIHRADPLPRVVERHGFPVIGLDRRLVDCWAVLPDERRRLGSVPSLPTGRTSGLRLRCELC